MIRDYVNSRQTKASPGAYLAEQTLIVQASLLAPLRGVLDGARDNRNEQC